MVEILREPIQELPPLLPEERAVYEDRLRRIALARPDLATAFIDYPDVAEELITMMRNDALRGKKTSEEDLFAEDFTTIPVSIDKFIGDPQLCGKWYVENLFDCWKSEICTVINRGTLEWVLTGSIGAGKTSAAMLAQMYKLYVVTCMRDPCSFYTATSITFGMYSAMRYLAFDVGANMLMTRLKESPYFRDVVGLSEEEDDPRKMKLKIFNFPNNVRFIFGSSSYHGMGQDVFGCIMDEVAFFESANAKKARELYASIRTRIASRFMSSAGLTPGIMCLCSSANYEGDFLDEHVANSALADRLYVSRFAQYDVKPFPGKRFRVLVGDRVASSKLLDEVIRHVDGTKEVRAVVPADQIPEDARIEHVPIQWYTDYKDDLPQALKDISGIAMSAETVFFPSMEKVDASFDPKNPLVTPRVHPFKTPSVTLAVTGKDAGNTLEDALLVEELFTLRDRFKKLYAVKINPLRPRFIHIDLAETTCAAGISCVHLQGFKSVEQFDAIGNRSEVKMPVVYVDFTLQVQPPEDMSEIDFSKFLTFVFYLMDMGMKIGGVSYDQYQSHHSQQVFEKVGIPVQEISLDRSPAAYNLLKQFYYADCINAYPYPLLRQELYRLRRKTTSARIMIVKPDGGCFVGETRVPTLDGGCPMIKDLDGKEVWVYASTADGRIVPGRARGRRTKKTSELVDVLLDNGMVERCTPDHRWRLRDGSYKRADELEPGVDRLMPLKRRWPFNGGYERVTDAFGRRSLTHNLVYEAVTGRRVPRTHVVHHDNEIKTDNRPDNLKLLEKSRHASHHATKRHAEDRVYHDAVVAGARRFNESPSGKAKHAAAIRRTVAGMSKQQLRDRARARFGFFRSDITYERLVDVLQGGEAGSPGAAARVLGCGRNVILRVLRDNGFASWAEFQAGYNHRVRAVIPVKSPPVWVYDLEVDEHCNFALASGVFVHNSKDISDSLGAAVYNLATSEYVREASLLMPVESGRSGGSAKPSMLPDFSIGGVDWLIRSSSGTGKITGIR